MYAQVEKLNRSRSQIYGGQDSKPKYNNKQSLFNNVSGLTKQRSVIVSGVKKAGFDEVNTSEEKADYLLNDSQIIKYYLGQAQSQGKEQNAVRDVLLNLLNDNINHQFDMTDGASITAFIHILDTNLGIQTGFDIGVYARQAVTTYIGTESYPRADVNQDKKVIVPILNVLGRELRDRPLKKETGILSNAQKVLTEMGDLDGSMVDLNKFNITQKNRTEGKKLISYDDHNKTVKWSRSEHINKIKESLQASSGKYITYAKALNVNALTDQNIQNNRQGSEGAKGKVESHLKTSGGSNLISGVLHDYSRINGFDWSGDPSNLTRKDPKAAERKNLSLMIYARVPASDIIALVSDTNGEDALLRSGVVKTEWVYQIAVTIDNKVYIVKGTDLDVFLVQLMEDK